MSCGRMKFRHKCQVSFDPGGKCSKCIALVVALIVIIPRFGGVYSSAAVTEERPQRRQQFPELSSTPLRPISTGFSGDADSTQPWQPQPKDQTELRKDDVLLFQPKKFTRHSNNYATIRLSNLPKSLVNLDPKSVANNYVKLLKHLFLEKNHRTKSFVDEVKHAKNQFASLDGEKEEPDSIRHVGGENGGKMSRSHTLRVINAGVEEHRRLVKRDTGVNPASAAENLTSGTDKDGKENPEIDVGTTAPNEGHEEPVLNVVNSPKRTATSQPRTTSPKPEAQADRQSEGVQPAASNRPTTQKPQTLPPRNSAPEKSPQTPSQRNLAPDGKETSPPRASPSPTDLVQDTEEAPTSTDGSIEENNVSCVDAQCYASRLPYHWTSDASWALGSMIFLMCVLTFFVLYTGLWKKRNPMSFPLDSSVPPDPHQKINIADLLKTRLAAIPRHLRSKRHVHRKRMNGRRYEELPLHQPNGTCNDEELDYFEDDDEDNLYLREEHTV